MHFILLLCSLIPVLKSSQFPPFDFVEDGLKQYVNFLADPCEDFYRHVCPIGVGRGVETAFKELMNFIEESQKDSFWKNLEVKNAYDSFDTIRQLHSMRSFIEEVGNEVCEKGLDDVSFAEKVIEILKSNMELEQRLSSGKEDEPETKKKRSVENCKQIMTVLDTAIVAAENRTNITLIDRVNYFQLNIDQIISLADAIGAHLHVDVRHGIEQTAEIVDKMVLLANEWVRDTPWALNNNVSERIEKITSQLHVHDNYGKDLLELTNILAAVEKVFTNCLNEYGRLENGKLFCYAYTASSRIISGEYDGFSVFDNAFNAHPELIFGFPNYYHQQYGVEMASKLGYTGFTAGHEIGHTFIENHEHPEILPFFSQEAQECILNQYNKTCTEFREASCLTSEIMLDEDGADILGVQLAYELLVEFYGEELKAINKRLGVTNEQLFFYSFALQFCNGAPNHIDYIHGELDVHASLNVRVNAVAQHPGFQAAFECSPDSRMMRSATEQCFIYGENAPENKRRHRRYIK